MNIDSRTPLLRGGTAHIYNNHYLNINETGINSRAGARAKVDNNYFEDSKDVLGTFFTDEAGFWQVSGNIFDNVTWSSRSGDHNPAGPDPQSNTTVSIPYSYTLDGASECWPGPSVVRWAYTEGGRWLREAATVNASSYRGILTTRNVLDTSAGANGAWAVPACVLAALVDTQHLG